MITTVARLAAEARTGPEFMPVARLYAGRDEVYVAPLVDELAMSEAVPYLPALRYTDLGVRKYAQWLQTWELQRREDAGEDGARSRPLPSTPWYDEPDPDPALDRPGSQIASLVDAELRALHLTADDIAKWRPEPARRGRWRRVGSV